MLINTCVRLKRRGPRGGGTDPPLSIPYQTRIKAVPRQVSSLQVAQTLQALQVQSAPHLQITFWGQTPTYISFDITCISSGIIYLFDRICVIYLRSFDRACFWILLTPPYWDETWSWEARARLIPIRTPLIWWGCQQTVYVKEDLYCRNIIVRQSNSIHSRRTLLQKQYLKEIKQLQQPVT